MNRSLRRALDRTLLLLRDEVRAETPDATLIDALTSTKAVLVSDRANVASHSAQSALITCALLMARSGLDVYVMAPDVPLLGAQPPLTGTHLVSALTAVGQNLLPGRSIRAGAPVGAADVAVYFGDTHAGPSAPAEFAIHAAPWSGFLVPRTEAPRWPADQHWPMGGMAAAALAAGEALKTAIKKLRPWAKDQNLFDNYFAPLCQLRFNLADPLTPQPADLGSFDFISGGAITHATLYCLARLIGVRGTTRVIDRETSDITNLNRYMLLLRSRLGDPKGLDLAALLTGLLDVHPVLERYETRTIATIGTLAPRVLIGVDHIPSRWAVQEANPLWLGVGATSHWSTMASTHPRGMPCAGCLHPSDDPIAGDIPTAAVVSFWSGLLLATYFLRDVTGLSNIVSDQQTYLTVFCPNTVWRTPVAFHPHCPVTTHNGVGRLRA